MTTQTNKGGPTPVLRQGKPSPATSAEPPAIGLYGTPINIEVGAGRRCGFAV